MVNPLKKIFKSDFIETDLDSYSVIVTNIRKREKEFQPWSDQEIFNHSKQLIEKAKHGDTLDDLLVDAYALVSESAFRKLKMRPFDVQLLAAIALHHGRVIEMQTGEGKTLAATMPVYLNALSGKGVHILTFNDYLAKRDAQWMQPIYEFLGLSVGYLQEGMTTEERKEVYQKDITYLTAKEGGFDYLRTFLVTDINTTVQPKVNFAIVDEVDSILIDEARTPMVIAGQVEQHHSVSLYHIAVTVKILIPHQDFQTDEFALNIFLTDHGINKVERELGCGNLYTDQNHELLVRINQSLQAQWLLKRDVDYIVRNDKIELVDEFTGRIVENRKWPHGLQAAIEAKENITLQSEGKILGKTTLQHFINSYPKISGMTGTAKPAAEEFASIYGMLVAVIPPNKSSCRTDQPDLIFHNKEAKLKTLIEEIKKVHRTGRPILVGTSTIEESEMLANKLLKENIPCQTLNAKNDEQEAVIIAKAGMLGALTISTNMAGRGTDIKLGGDEGIDRNKILELGGLYVIGTNRFESRRIDNQLRGRAGRQGDVGESRFFTSLEDELLKKHGIDELIPKRLRQPGKMTSVNHAIINREVDRAQRIVEGKNFDIRKTLWKYASLIEVQRKIVHQRRQLVLAEDFESLLPAYDEPLYQKLIHQFGQPLIQKVEAQITMAIIDQHWADYLEETDHIRQSIHFVTLGGMNPFYEFQKKVAALFTELLEKIDLAIIHKIRIAQITAEGIDLEKEGLTAPTSTWTYLVNDNPFGDKLEMMLRSTGNIGFAAGAAILWPLLMLYFIAKKVFKKK